jgi:hypothetical protein
MRTRTYPHLSAALLVSDRVDLPLCQEGSLGSHERRRHAETAEPTSIRGSAIAEPGVLH